MGSIALVDSNQLYLEALETVLANSGRVSVCWRAKGRDEAIDKLLAGAVSIVLLGTNLPCGESLYLANDIRESAPGTRVLVTAGSADRVLVGSFLSVGVAGIVDSRNVCCADLLEVIDTLMSGQSWFCPSIASTIALGLGGLAPGSAQDDQAELTPREAEVLQLIASGATTREAASSLCISAKTIETHRSAIMAKTGLNSVASLTRYAIAIGITSCGADGDSCTLRHALRSLDRRQDHRAWLMEFPEFRGHA